MSQKKENTVSLYRVLRAPADRIYRAFLEPDAKCKWLPPHGYVAAMHESDMRVGGKYRMSFTNFRTGQAHFFGGKITELTPYERIRYTDKFEEPSMPEEINVTVSLREVSCGTELTITQENLPPQIPVESCYLGWQESLMQLSLLVDPENS